MNSALVASAVAGGDFGLAAHAIQDRYAKGHADFALWEGFGKMGFSDFLEHLWADMFPSDDEVVGAYEATKAMFKGTRKSGTLPAAIGRGGGPESRERCGALMIIGCNSPNDPLPNATAP